MQQLPSTDDSERHPGLFGNNMIASGILIPGVPLRYYRAIGLMFSQVQELGSPLRVRSRKTETEQEGQRVQPEISLLQAPVEQVIAHFKSWRIFHTDYRRPYFTCRDNTMPVAGCSSRSPTACPIHARRKWGCR